MVVEIRKWIGHLAGFDKEKYIKGKYTGQIKHRRDDSSMWTDLLKARWVYLKGRKLIVYSGRNTLFWLDTWWSETPCANNFLCRMIWVMINLLQYMIAKQMVRCVRQLKFRRRLYGALRDQWVGIREYVMNYSDDVQKDVSTWRDEQNRVFSLLSLPMII